MDLERTNYKLELYMGDDGNFRFRWNLAGREYHQDAKVRFYEGNERLLGENRLNDLRGEGKTSIPVNPGVYMRYIGAAESYNIVTSPYPETIQYMTNDIYFVSSSVSVTSMKLGARDGRVQVHVETSAHWADDFVGLYDSANAPDDQPVERHEMLHQATSDFSFQTFIRPGYHLRYITKDANGALRKVRITKELPDIRIHEKVDIGTPGDAVLDDLINKYPHLNRDSVLITDFNQCMDYNCIAWSLGFDDRWINPLDNVKQMAEFYAEYGCRQTAAPNMQAIDLWVSGDKPVHASKLHDTQHALWESKRGQNYRMTHNRDGLRGNEYGSPLCSFTAPSMDTVYKKRQRKEWSCGELRVIQSETDRIPMKIGEAFEEKFSYWKKQWKTEPFMSCSNTNDLKGAPGWRELYEMGEEILPLVVRKLCDEENFPALVLYDDLQREENLVIGYTKDWIEGEQARAARTVEKWVRSMESPIDND